MIIQFPQQLSLDFSTRFYQIKSHTDRYNWWKEFTVVWVEIIFSGKTLKQKSACNDYLTYWGKEMGKKEIGDK